MATGIQSTNNNKRSIVVRLLEDIAAANSTLPTVTPALSATPTSTQFFDLSKLGNGFVFPEDSTIQISESGTSSGALTIAYVRVWLYDAVTGKSYPAGTGTDADKGKINGGAALGVTATDRLRHREPLLFLGHADGIQLEVGAIGGTTPTFNLDLVIPRYARR